MIEFDEVQAVIRGWHYLAVHVCSSRLGRGSAVQTDGKIGAMHKGKILAANAYECNF